MSNALLKVSDVSELTQLRPETIRQEIGEGRLRAYRFGTRYRIDPKDVDSWLESRLVVCRNSDESVPLRGDSEAETYAIGKVAS